MKRREESLPVSNDRREAISALGKAATRQVGSALSSEGSPLGSDVSPSETAETCGLSPGMPSDEEAVMAGRWRRLTVADRVELPEGTTFVAYKVNQSPRPDSLTEQLREAKRTGFFKSRAEAIAANQAQ